MRLISLGHAVQATRDTINRFPLAILSAFVATVTAFAMIEGPSDDALPRLLATSILGLALFTASVTSAERRGVAVRHRWVVDLLLVAGLALLFRASQSWTDRMAGLRFVQLLLAGHLLVAIAPYLTAVRLDGFWQFNRLLFLRYLTGAFYAGVLWIGLAVALAALDRLFGVHVPGETYGKLFALLAFGFHPWFFLAGVPRDYDGLEQRSDYPAGLKVFTQFVLMPLVAVYLLILTAYLAKVMLTRTWPNGWIGYLVSSVATTGVLALLLVHPLRERADNRWVDVYGRWWFVALLPSLGMLLAAIAKRVGQYGMTEPRYFLLVLALWLSALALFYAISASRNIKLIPMTLAAVTVLTAAGPWSAFAVSRRSQINRLNRILAAHDMGHAGAVVPVRGAVSLEDRRQLSGVLQYLSTTHGPRVLAQAMGVSDAQVRAWSDSLGGSPDALASQAMTKLGLRYASPWERSSSIRPFYANRGAQRSVDVAGFELVRAVNLPAATWIGNGADSLELTVPDSAGVVQIRHAGTTLFALDILAAVRAAVPSDSLETDRGAVLTAPVVVEGMGGGYRLRLVLESVSGEVTATGLVWHSASGLLLVSGFSTKR